MASYVFVYKNENYPNIHGHASSYRGRVLQAYADKSDFKNIKSRYLSTLQQQLASQQANLNSKDYIEGLSLAEFEQLESQLEQQLVTQYNERVDQLAAKTTLYTDTVKALESTIKNKTDKNLALKLIDQLINIFKSNSQDQGFIDDLNSSTDNISATIEEIIGARNLKIMVEKIFDENVQYSPQWLSSVLTAPSEALAAYIDAYAEGLSDEVVLAAVERSMLGTQSSKVIASIPLKEGFKELKPVTSKAADLQLGNTTYSQTISLGPDGVVETIDLTVVPYVSVKTYRGRSRTLELTSYSGINSLVVPALLEIYGDTDETRYQIYNTLAFSKEQEAGTSLDTNFRIIRQDMITLFAERFIAGFNPMEAQRLLVYNFKAYPILSIISAIIEDAQKQEMQLKNRQYGSLSKGDVFSISFQNAQAIQNDYIGQKNSLALKAERIKKVKAAIDRLATSGQLNSRALSMVDKKFLQDGIPIQDLRVDKK